uniref:Secreted protein n=1 Tax=Nonomuraea gerenzanensis TaxID=93944 RepID=A0A1M4EB55_9ACTN|nr:secreted protein [Nonomuraea gerenzanensis]
MLAPHPSARPTSPPPATAWEETLARVTAGDAAGLAAYLVTLDDPARRKVAAELPGYVTATARTAGWREWAAQGRPLLVAGVACLGGASAVTAWLFRRELPRWLDDRDHELLLGLLRRRPVEWQADVARRVAARMRLPEPRHWYLAAALVRETGIEPPDGEPFIVGWLRRLHPETAGRDPFVAAYGPRILEVDALAQAPLWQVVETVARLVHDGLLDRAAVVGAIVRRLLRDGPAARSELATLHDRLDLDLDESARYARDYTALLPAGPVAVADVALAQLRRLEEAGRLEEELFAEAMGALAFRPEKKLLRAAVSWAGDAVLRDAGRVDTVLGTLATIFTQDTLALQERAVRLAVRLAPQAGPAGRDPIRQAAAELPSELLEKISAAYGGGIAEAAPPAAPPLWVGEGPPLPPPVASPQELVQELQAFRWPPDVYAFERLLAGLIEWSHRAPGQLRQALRPWWHPFSEAAYGIDGHQTLFTAVSRAFLAFADPARSRKLTAGAAARRRYRHSDAPGAPELLYRRRAMELVTPFENGTGYPVLLATPTSGTGHLAPSVLLDRLERLEAAGVEALPADLAQALLRLPRRFETADVERAVRLTSEAGRTCAAWMRDGGMPDPEATVTVRRTDGGVELQSRLTPPAHGLPEEIRALFEPQNGHTYSLTWWPLALPAHREIAAAHLVGYLPWSMDANDRQTQALTTLAHGDGPIGAATAHALVCGMSHVNPAERAAATDAFLTLAAHGETPAQALAEAVTSLVTADLVKLNRVVSVLDDATQAGAHEAVWAVVSGVLAGLLPREGERPRAGVADLLAAGARAARIAGVRARLPEVAAVAGRKGSSRLTQEARRLVQLVGTTD